ncbi:MAG: Dabb family protein [Verrucomicrobiota bacterium]
MKKIILSVVVLLTFSLLGWAAESEKTEMLRHVVILKFKADASTGEIKKVEDAFRALKTKIPGVAALEWGTNVSPEKLNQGFTHCFVLSFKTEKERDAYLPHPEHKKFGKILRTVLEEALVIDYWTKE